MAFDRADALRRLATEDFDVVVVGGGITGAGVALDAATRGLRVALVEKQDFASGTSSKSSKLVHGGIRYLQQKEVGLVYEALAERQVLRSTAPHLVRVLPFLLPVFTRDGLLPGKLARILGRDDVGLRPHRGPAHRQVPQARHQGRSTRADADAAGRPAGRLVRLLRRAGGRRAPDPRGRTDRGRLRLGGGQLCRTDRHRERRVGSGHPRARTGRRHGHRGADARHCERDGCLGRPDPDARRRQGSRLDPARQRRPCHGALAPRAQPDRDGGAGPEGPSVRVVVPWEDRGNGEFAFTYIGTTDTDYEGPLDDPQCTPDDIGYLLRAINASVTTTITERDVLGTWAGLRPLVRRAGSERTADLSRRHAVLVSPGRVVTVTGGKLTTYRRMAADAVDEVSKLLGRSGRSRTKQVKLHGATGWDAPDLRAPLNTRYGSDARNVLALTRADPLLGAPLVDGLDYLRAEVVHAARHEMARSVDDVLARRTRARLLARDASADAAPDVAALLGAELGWTSAEQHRQVERYRALVRAERDAGDLPATTLDALLQPPA